MERRTARTGQMGWIRATMCGLEQLCAHWTMRGLEQLCAHRTVCGFNHPSLPDWTTPPCRSHVCALAQTAVSPNLHAQPLHHPQPLYRCHPAALQRSPITGLQRSPPKYSTAVNPICVERQCAGSSIGSARSGMRRPPSKQEASEDRMQQIDGLPCVQASWRQCDTPLPIAART